MVAIVRCLGLSGSIAIFATSALKTSPPSAVVVDKLDQHYQAVLHDMTLTAPTKYEVTDVHGKKRIVTSSGFFGASRLDKVRLIEGGHGMIDNRLGHQASRLAAAKALTGWREWVFLVGAKTDRLTVSNARMDRSLGWGAILKGVSPYAYPTGDHALKLAKAALSGRPHVVDGSADEWTVSARPVVFESPKCLSCHQDSKLGDAAGVLVYALHRDASRVFPDRVVGR